MSEDEFLDALFKTFEGTGDIFSEMDEDEIESLFESDEEMIYLGLHERLMKHEKPKELLFSALKSDDEIRIDLANEILYENSADFFSVDEINDLLNSVDKLNELNIDKKSIVGLIVASGDIEKYLTPEYIKVFNLTRGSVAELIEKTGNIEKYLTPEIIKASNMEGYKVAKLIEKSGNIEKLLTPEIIKASNMEGYKVAELIEKSGNIEKYLTPEYIKDFNLDVNNVVQLIEKSGNIEKYLTPEYIKDFNLDGNNVTRLIEKSGNIEKYLTPEYIKDFNLDGEHVAQLIKKTGNIEKYLTPEIIKASNMNGYDVAILIKESGNIEKLLTPEIIKASNMEGYKVAELIEKSGNIEKLLTLEIIKASNMNGYQVSILIEESGNIEKYLTPEYIKDFDLDGSDVTRLIVKTGNIEKYLTPEYIKDFNLDGNGVTRLIEKTDNIEKYLTPEYIKDFNLDGNNVTRLIEKSGNIEKYLTPEIIKASNMDDYEVAELIKKTGNIKKYLTPEKIKELGLDGRVILLSIGIPFSTETVNILNKMIDNGTYTVEIGLNLKRINDTIRKSNSGQLNRIANEVLGQIITMPLEEQKKAAEEIRKIFETSNIPNFAKNFMVFERLNPGFMEDKNQRIGDIPSLNSATPVQKRNIIFSDLLKISIESSSRNVREYLNIIEYGDKLFEMFKEGNLQIDSTLPEENRVILKKYCDMLNAMYNQTGKVKHDGKARTNSGNLAQDLTELNELFSSDKNIHIPLRDRIVRTFGYWGGIRDFEQAKTILEETLTQADKRNRETVRKGDFSIKKGDLAKGIGATAYFPGMLQNGIVAKDYLGANSDSDLTPLDADVELVKEDETMATAPSYTRDSTEGRNLGKIIIIIKKDERYVKTREGNVTDENAVKTVIEDRTKIEYFDNSGTGGYNAHGIRTGIGSTNISFIIADRYVDKLGLEIAMNGFYIPIIDHDKKLLYTP